ncbi:MAG: HesA/MoeB/ThiF family protein [Thermoplasmata archaeon]|nr:HesA/MoeB/ThiF family protein [Thermoplasmata archaeon]
MTTPARYSRLAIFPHADLEKLREKRILIVGAGGLGAVCADILTRLGAGKIVIFDYDTLEMENLNRMIYKTEQVGMKKVEALKEYLNHVNPDVEIIPYPLDITGDGHEAFIKELEKSDIVLGCVDSFGVRMFINAKCVELKKTYVDGGTSLDGIRGSVHTIIPGKTACYRCHVVSQKTDYPVKTEGHETGTCHAVSLPTTMGIIAALECQEALKILLGFGNTVPYIIYDGLNGTMNVVNWKRNPRCQVCGKKGKERMDKRKFEELENIDELFEKLM